MIMISQYNAVLSGQEIAFSTVKERDRFSMLRHTYTFFTFGYDTYERQITVVSAGIIRY